jgi:hypothetical protein
MARSAAVLGFAVLGACRTAPRGGPVVVHARLGEDFRVIRGQDAVIDGEPLAVRFASVVEDSRCPVDARCVRAGEAKVQIVLRLPRRGPEEVILSTEGGQPRYATYDRYDVRLVSLAPEPRTTVAHPLYLATLRITRE